MFDAEFSIADVLDDCRIYTLNLIINTLYSSFILLNLYLVKGLILRGELSQQFIKPSYAYMVVVEVVVIMVGAY